MKSLSSFSISIVSLSTEFATFPESSMPRVKNLEPTRPFASREITPETVTFRATDKTDNGYIPMDICREPA